MSACIVSLAHVGLLNCLEELLFDQDALTDILLSHSLTFVDVLKSLYIT
jgi:hypothetical protein